MRKIVNLFYMCSLNIGVVFTIHGAINNDIFDILLGSTLMAIFSVKCLKGKVDV